MAVGAYFLMAGWSLIMGPFDEGPVSLAHGSPLARGRRCQCWVATRMSGERDAEATGGEKGWADGKRARPEVA